MKSYLGSILAKERQKELELKEINGREKIRLRLNNQR